MSCPWPQCGMVNLYITIFRKQTLGPTHGSGCLENTSAPRAALSDTFSALFGQGL